MSSNLVSLLAFIGMFAGAMVAQVAARRLSEHHVSARTQDTVKLGVGMVAAMTSLILGLMTASVKSNFDSTDKDVHTYALSILSLETDLRHAGPAGCQPQMLLMDYTRAVLQENWTDTRDLPKTRTDTRSADILLNLDTVIRTWAPDTELLKEVRAAAISDLRAILTTRWTVSEEAVASVPGPFILVLIIWLSLIFVSFGLFAPQNAIVSVFFFMCALSIAGALFLILEMSGPFDGLISVSPQPLVRALEFIQANGCK
ncbi:MAG: hypothetical protein B7Y01_01500 [Xanthobacter sp. 17-67-6]|nr:MAG: hypothetical protein B7Y84_19805 [Azorhizobium sp. 32-67-21]OYY09468.1 MAG: hypothetical protein B7Y70_10110 [Rhizobiales bacterium 35-68-8]OYZ92880.1 MAG: hypothetical protein B7Y01_01500 [Xanthobacter sp. 17-67-6]